MAERIWSYALTNVEMFAALHRYIEETRRVKLPVTGENMLHLVTHRGGECTTYEFWSEKVEPPKPVQTFRWFWQSRATPPHPPNNPSHEGGG